MSFTIQLPATIEHHLRQDAAKKGLSIERYIMEVLTEKTASKTAPKSRERHSESTLLELVQLRVQAADLEEYYRLSAQFHSGKISPEGYEKLLQLNDLIEVAHADRMIYVLEYANLKGVSLESAMDLLSIKRHVA